MEHIREFKDEDYQIRLDLRQQVLGLDILEEEAWSAPETRILPTLPMHSCANFVSAGALAMKAKQFDDGLYAAVDLAAQNGAGIYPGKVFLLTTLAQSLMESATAGGAEALALILGACDLGGLRTLVPQAPNEEVEREVKQGVEGFLQEQLCSKPVGFYTWSQDLECLFRQDRMLQRPLQAKTSVAILAGVLNANNRMRDAYTVYLDLASRLTNPPAKPDLRQFLDRANEDRMQDSVGGVCFFPPSRAHETDLIKKVYGDRLIPDGVNLMDELIAHIRSGKLRLAPSDKSGWYDYQLWSIEPLAIPKKMPEEKRLVLEKRYTEHLLELFKGIYALTRETHVKQLESPATCALTRPRKRIHIPPELSAEPLPTFYLRRAMTYRFVHRVLVETFGADALHRLHRLTPTGHSKLSLAQEFKEMEALFYGAYATVSAQLGLTPDSSVEAGSGDGPEADAARFIQWAGNPQGDQDLNQDARMMVPVLFDIERGKTKVWLMLGWRTKPLRIHFDTPPRVIAVEAAHTAHRGPGLFSRILGKVRQPEVVFTETYRDLACPVFAEAYVDRILNRDEFQRHCDTFKTESLILENLI